MKGRCRVIGLTLGDAGGIGPEVVIKAAFRSRLPALTSLLLIGDHSIIRRWVKRWEYRPPQRWVNDGTPFESGKIYTYQPRIIPGVDRVVPGVCSATAARAAVAWIEAAVELALGGYIDGIVTGPINKAGLHKARIAYPGHTEMLAELTGTRRYAMMLIGGALRVVLATRHIPLSAVPRQLTTPAIVEAAEMADEGLKWFGLRRRKIGICALNPHAGEGGAMGDEEKRVITPAVSALKKAECDVTGPVPADVIFHQAYRRKLDAVVAMYHDQGLGPLKMIGFESGINITLGLPILRTSPDHGTAYDIAGKGTANSRSTEAALNLAIRLSRRANPWRRHRVG